MARKMPSLQDVCLKAVQQELIQGRASNLWSQGEFQSIDIKFVSQILNLQENEKFPIFRLCCFWGCSLDTLDLSVFDIQVGEIDELLGEGNLLNYFPSTQTLSMKNMLITGIGKLLNEDIIESKTKQMFIAGV